MRAGLKFVFFASYAKIITNLLSFSEVAPTGSFAVLQLIRWFLGFDQGRSTIDDTNQRKTGPPQRLSPEVGDLERPWLGGCWPCGTSRSARGESVIESLSLSVNNNQ